MNKKVIFFIVAAVVLIGAGVAAYFLFFQDGDAAKDSNPAPPAINPAGTPVSIPGQGSTLITSGATGVLTPGFANLNEGNLSSRHVFTSPGTNPAKVHFTVGFNQQCDPYIWYNDWLYAFLETVQDQNTGLRTCYYAVNKSKLPAELMVLTPASGKCTNFKLYVSGVEYRYNGNRNLTIGMASIPHCVYKKI